MTMSKVLVSFDDALLRRLDRKAAASGLSRSAYLASVAERDLAATAGPGKDPGARLALKKLDRLLAGTAPGDSTDLIRAERDAR